MTTRSGSRAMTVSMSKFEFIVVLSFSVAASRSSARLWRNRPRDGNHLDPQFIEGEDRGLGHDDDPSGSDSRVRGSV